ncbi:short-chain fatty acid transporter [Psychroflexus salis]|uniref:Short-chain fatty acid transporter n=1 Tax=Psychroflexus salis TaxID=1526574 RepID=A0A916ZM98_9FLAO|nr:TIGR00366 family protein [Psychroflexus salis]GGE02842.1 short-chain fatty acid transporter [Psychroflexus salis]
MKKLEKLLPTPFALAILLTLLSIVLALIFTSPPTDENHFIAILSYWENGIWNEALLVFAYQMMFILVLGHILALSKPVQKLLNFLTGFIYNTTTAVIWVSFFTLVVSFFNWGLCLIFGALLVRKIGEKSVVEGFTLNYPLLGAAGYVGMMAWHGGMSGSAPLKVAEINHLPSLFADEKWQAIGSNLPTYVSTSQTIFSLENLIVFTTLLLLIPLFFWWLAKQKQADEINLKSRFVAEENQVSSTTIHGLESSPWVGIGFGILLILAFVVQYSSDLKKLQLTPNMLNFLMLGLGFILHTSIFQFKQALAKAIRGAGGILIQFPLYFGIMGIMKDSGLVSEIANLFSNFANEEFLPILTFFSAGLVNIFVPSGGGQWAVQGPIAIESALKLGVDLPKMIMALAYGDQITNMLQPFWALPLLAITKLKAHEIFPYTLLIFIVGSLIFMTSLYFVF